MNVKQFSEKSIRSMEYAEPFYYSFGCAMVCTCAPLFDKCGDNYEVADLLKRNGVIGPDDDEDSETCSMYVYFKTMEQGLAFLDRLNQYLRKRAETIVANRF